jgi:hypothetical protein
MLPKGNVSIGPIMSIGPISKDSRATGAATGVISAGAAGSTHKGERLLAALDDRLEALRRDLHATDPPAYRKCGSHCP